jgi:hypothetical protein
MRSCCEGKCAARAPNIGLRKHDIMVGYVVSTSLCLSGMGPGPLAYSTGTQLVVYIDMVCSVVMSE